MPQQTEAVLRAKRGTGRNSLLKGVPNVLYTRVYSGSLNSLSESCFAQKLSHWEMLQGVFLPVKRAIFHF